MFLGIDIGSSSSKIAAVDENKRILGFAVRNIGTGTKGADQCMEELMGRLGATEDDITYSIVTGYGRMTYKKADRQITEITCHAKGVSTLYPGARSIIDIGGQDAKAIQLKADGSVENFVMNEKCAAGTGRFFEVMARVLDCSLEELALLAEEDEEPVTISSMCTVFAESEVISQLASGATHAAVAKGAHIAVAKRVTGLAKRIRLKSDLVMTGGVAMNTAMVKCLGQQIGMEVIQPSHPQVMGAIGAAMLAYEQYHRKQGARV